MKILITTDLFKPAINGVVTSILNLEKELEGQGHEVRILTVSRDMHTHREGNVYYVESIPFPIYPDVRLPISGAGAFVEELIAWGPDVVHSQCEFFSYFYAKKIAERAKAKLVHTYHTLYEQYTEYVPAGKYVGRAVLGKWMKFRLKKADMIIAPTKKVERTLNEYGIASDIRIVPTGICLEQFREPVKEAELDRLRRVYGIEKEDKVLLNLGRLGYEKRIDELLHGMKEVHKTEKHVKLLIVGDGPARESLERLAEELNLSGCVRFAGMVQPEEVKKYYRLGDVFVCASTSETQGLTYIEAAAGGLPLICRKDPCLYGVLEEGGNGFAYSDIYRFAKYVRNYVNDEEWLARAGAHSRKISEQYGTRRFGKTIEGIYKTVLRKEVYAYYEGIALCEKPANRI